MQRAPPRRAAQAARRGAAHAMLDFDWDAAVPAGVACGELAMELALSYGVGLMMNWVAWTVFGNEPKVRRVLLAASPGWRARRFTGSSRAPCGLGLCV